MRYSIRHETANSIRLRLFSDMTAEDRKRDLKSALLEIDGIQKVTFYPATSGLRLEYSCGRQQLLESLDRLCPSENMAEAETEAPITSEELERRKLHPEVKKKMRNEILAEAVADLILPMPVQFAYHVYQIAKLKSR